MDAITVEVWSDVACPWCFIGKRRFEEGVRLWAAEAAQDGPGQDGVPDVAVTYRSYELSPDTPVEFEGSEADFLAGHKRLPRDQVEQMLEHVAAVATSVGLTYDVDAVQHTNTRRAHEVVHLAAAHGRQREMVERLFRAYFEQGRHLGRDAELADLAADVGLDRAEVLESLAERRYAPAVDADIELARTHGVTAVPFAAVDGRYAVVGAQEPRVFAEALRRAVADRAEAADGAPDAVRG